jgi:hypothetical protein
MALDKKGKIWFLEGNNQPQCARCKLVNDKLSQEKYEEARRWLLVPSDLVKGPDF